ncbi:hypothetical protein [Actinomadura monticuli]|uniref:Secreted protein n=1 Tax=Actinomadura monticuli TaxID=3097367 RepID=A0ABV4QP83_9ACTN
MPLFLRIAVLAGLAFAGWLVLSALSDSAFAAEQPPNAAHADGPRPATLGHVTSGLGGRTIEDGLREVGDDPMRYVRSRQRDLFDDKDRAVRHVSDLADQAGVPRVQIPDVRQQRPVIGELVQRVTDPRPAQQQAAHERPDEHADEEPDAAGAAHRAAGKDAVSETRHTATRPAAPADRKAGDCSRCGGDHRAPAHGPVQPGQDVPQGGGSAGGHPLAPVADLPNRRHPAAPPAMDASTFQRTALTDVAAPGGPSVVPD